MGVVELFGIGYSFVGPSRPHAPAARDGVGHPLQPRHQRGAAPWTPKDAPYGAKAKGLCFFGLCKCKSQSIKIINAFKKGKKGGFKRVREKGVYKVLKSVNLKKGNFV